MADGALSGLRVLTLNIWNRQGPWEQRLAVIRRGLAELEPDVVGLQEVLRHRPPEIEGRGNPPASGEDTVRPPTERSPGAPKVGAVILNYNGKALAERCVRSLLDSRYANLHIFVVDNASTDGSAEYLRSLFPGIHILECAKNLGITGGRNRRPRW